MTPPYYHNFRFWYKTSGTNVLCIKPRLRVFMSVCWNQTNALEVSACLRSAAQTISAGGIFTFALIRMAERQKSVDWIGIWGQWDQGRYLNPSFLVKYNFGFGFEIGKPFLEGLVVVEKKCSLHFSSSPSNSDSLTPKISPALHSTAHFRFTQCFWPQSQNKVFGMKRPPKFAYFLSRCCIRGGFVRPGMGLHLCFISVECRHIWIFRPKFTIKYPKMFGIIDSSWIYNYICMKMRLCPWIPDLHWCASFKSLISQRGERK